MKDLDIHTVEGTASGTVSFGCGMNDQGWCYGQGSTTIVAWTNNLGKTVKFLPISGIIEGAKTVAPGEQLHSTISGSYHSLTYKSSVTTSASTPYKFYLIY